MSRRLTAAVLSATLTLTSLSTAPAQAADEGEIARFLLGASALFIIGKSIADNDEVRRKPTVVPRVVEPSPQRNRKALPADCLRRVATDSGTRRYFANRCLKNNYRYTASLPDRCERVFRLGNGKRRQGFAANCLRKRGYTVAW